MPEWERSSNELSDQQSDSALDLTVKHGNLLYIDSRMAAIKLVSNRPTSMVCLTRMRFKPIECKDVAS